MWGIDCLTDFWGIGEKTAQKLHQKKIDTIGDLANYNPFLLKESMGAIGVQLHAHANGIDRSRIDQKFKPLEKSVSNSQILLKDYTNIREIEVIVREMSDLVASRLRKIHAQTECIRLSIGYSDSHLIRGFSHQMKIPATANTKQLTAYALQLFYNHYEYFSVRTVAVSCSKLIYQTSIQLDLFSDPEKMVQEEKLDYLCDKIRNRYGFKALVHASSLLPGATAISRSSKIGGH